MSAALVFAWLLVAAGVAAFRIEMGRREPDTLPGGGVVAIVIVALLWPLLLGLIPLAVIA